MVRLAENVGFGLDKIEQNWQQYNHTTPDIIREFDSTMITLIIEDTNKGSDQWGEKWGERWKQLRPEIEAWWIREIGTTLSISEIKILDIMAVYPEISMVQLAKHIGIVESAIGKNINKLKQKNIIERVGPAKGGHWKIIK